MRLPLTAAGAARAAALCAALIAPLAGAYGPEGHLIAGRAAAPLLCADAASAVDRFGGGEDLGELGVWADRIRSQPAYADTGPWHYMNIADGVSLAAYRGPPEGDVLAAIAREAARLGDDSLSVAARGEALRFFAHFIVDLHQPLHVGRADDRGGNAIALRFRGATTNLHRLWDSDLIAWTDRSLAANTAIVRQLAAEFAASREAIPAAPAGEADAADAVARASLSWAAESLALRPVVYGFGRRNRQPGDAYLDRAAAITEQRLAEAAARLAGSLNRIFCETTTRR